MEYKVSHDAAGQRLDKYARRVLGDLPLSAIYKLIRTKKIRVNTVSQSPSMTTAGSGIKGFTGLFDFADEMSPLGNAPTDDCAKYVISLFSELTKYVTMQNLFHDGGFSSTGATPLVVGRFDKE